MKVTKLKLTNFTAFEDLVCDFASGINVFIGENGTGKTHILKVIYAVSDAIRYSLAGHGKAPGAEAGPLLRRVLHEYLADVFRPDAATTGLSGRPDPSRLVRRRGVPGEATIRMDWDSGASIQIILPPSAGRALDDQVGLVELDGDFRSIEQSIFLPAREILSIYPGLTSAIRNRELAFDSTYLALGDALAAAPVKPDRRNERLAALIGPMEKAIRGKVVYDGREFYIRGSDGDIEAPLTAEGHRKLATVAYLLTTEYLKSNGFLLWDEPEGNLNPGVTKQVVELLAALAHEQIQIFVATHDYLLTSEISLLAEYPKQTPLEIAFFSLAFAASGTSVEKGDVMADIQNNPLLDAYSDHFDRETALAQQEIE